MESEDLAMKGVQLLAVVALLASAVLIGCIQTKSEVEVKPVDINLNITGRLELVITDAWQQEEKIAGAKPKRTVRTEDIGLPLVLKPKSDVIPSAATLTDDGPVLPVRRASLYAAAASRDRQAQLVELRAARHPQIEAMRDLLGFRLNCLFLLGTLHWSSKCDDSIDRDNFNVLGQR
jgi:hypothetical protein